MSYLTISQCAVDPDFNNRVMACVVDEGGNLNAMPPQIMWDVARAEDIEAAYAYALSVGIERPGADETVITDQMILSNVQPIINPPPPEVTET